MAEAAFDTALQIISLLLTALIYIAIVINIFTRKGFEQILFIISLVGYFVILQLINDFFLATTFISMWFVLMGSEFFLSRNILLGLFVLILLVGYSNPIFFLIATALYCITTVNFLFSTMRKIKSGKSGS